MAVIDNAVQALFKMANKKLVWENASPASAFPGQQITINDIKEGDVVIIEYKFGKAGTTYNLDAFVAESTKANTMYYLVLDSDEYIYANFRDVAVHVDTKQISFSGGHYRIFGRGTEPQDNSRTIPIRIFLIQNSII